MVSWKNEVEKSPSTGKIRVYKFLILICLLGLGGDSCLPHSLYTFESDF